MKSGTTLQSHKNSVLHLSDLKSERSLTAVFGAISPVVDGGSLISRLQDHPLRGGYLMQVMNLPELPLGPSSVEDCVQLYLSRLPADDAPWPHVSLLLTAYMAWPNDRPQRDSWNAIYLARFIQNSGGDIAGDRPAAKASKSRHWVTFEKFGGLGAVAKPAFDHMAEEIAQVQRRWLLVADIFQMIVDMAHDDRIALRRGASISKAIELCEIERTMPGHSQLRKAWSDFRDVAHLIAASARLAHEGLTKAAAHEASILKAIWIAPDAVVALAAGFQESGLQPKAVRTNLRVCGRIRYGGFHPGLCRKSPSLFFAGSRKSSWDTYPRDARLKSISPPLRLDGAGNDLSDLKSERCRTLRPIAIKDSQAVLANCEHR